MLFPGSNQQVFVALVVHILKGEPVFLFCDAHGGEHDVDPVVHVLDGFWPGHLGFDDLIQGALKVLEFPGITGQGPDKVASRLELPGHETTEISCCAGYEYAFHDDPPFVMADIEQRAYQQSFTCIYKVLGNVSQNYLLYLIIIVVVFNNGGYNYEIQQLSGSLNQEMNMIDENEFFRNATLAICGNLQIEQAMSDCIGVIGEHVPVDRMFLQLYEPELGAMRTMAMATLEEGKQVDLLTPLPQEARERVAMNIERPLDGAVIIDSPEKNPVARVMLKFHGAEGWSVLRMTLLTAHGRLGGVVLAVEGRDIYIGEHKKLLGLLKEPFTVAFINTLQHREVLRLRDRLADDNRYLHTELRRLSGDQIVGADFGLRDVMHQVQHVAPTESPVLLTGETGAGKDVIANAIHLGSPRRDGPFIPVNCGAIPESLLDSELFGHEKGAFTGALSQKRGRFERANKGTILLDEIGEMPLEAQVRLLRVIQHREIERVGGTERIPVDIRIIAATNQDPSELVKTGRFREDLYFRLNVFPINVPPLRERTSDIPALVQHLIERKAQELKMGDTPRLEDGAIDDLMAYDWPGNVRELENVIERAMILHRGEPLRFDDLGTSLTGRATTKEQVFADRPLDLDTVVAQHIKRVLGMTGGKIHGHGGAGELLAVNPNTLRYKMRKLGIPFRKDS